MNIKADMKEKIIAAAEALVAQGIGAPTTTQVREHMGGGSMSHISPVMREWREARKKSEANALEMPAALKQAVELSIGQVWATASKLASDSFETTRAECEAATDTATCERDEALSEVARLERRIEELQEALQTKANECQSLEKDLTRVKDDSTKKTNQITNLTTQIHHKEEQVSELRDQVKEFKAENKTLQSELIEIAKNNNGEKK